MVYINFRVSVGLILFRRTMILYFIGLVRATVNCACVTLEVILNGTWYLLTCTGVLMHIIIHVDMYHTVQSHG